MDRRRQMHFLMPFIDFAFMVIIIFLSLLSIAYFEPPGKGGEEGIKRPLTALKEEEKAGPPGSGTGRQPVEGTGFGSTGRQPVEGKMPDFPDFLSGPPERALVKQRYTYEKKIAGVKRVAEERRLTIQKLKMRIKNLEEERERLKGELKGKGLGKHEFTDLRRESNE